MATAAFKSTSRRGNQNPTTTAAAAAASASTSHNSDRNPYSRKRSQSVSEISRAKHAVDITSESYNKRENPLFLNSASSSTFPTGDRESNEISKRTEKDKRAVESTPKTASVTTAAAERGRSFTRNSGVKNGIGRSLSRVRGRSVSRGPYGAYESEKEQEMTMLTNREYNGDIKQVAINSKLVNKIRNGADGQRWRRSPQIMGSQSLETEGSEDDSVCSFPFLNLEDGTSTCSLSEAEDRITKAVYGQMNGNQSGGNATESGIYETVQSEVRRALSDIQNDIESAIRWSNVNGAAITDVTNIPPDLANSRPVELVLDIRREYARKLEESEERARKLRADLAVEEHRGQEFSRILKETLPPQTSNPQKSHMGRKRSTERKKISKRLTEEALAYFDECVSISTFDGSDFSASEDPLPPTSTGNSIPVYDAVSRSQRSSSISASLYAPDCSSNNKKTLNGHDQLMQCCEDSNLTVDSGGNAFSVEQDGPGTNSRSSNQKYQFSFAQKPLENLKSKNSIKSYLEPFQGGISVNARSDYDASECNLRGCVESLLFDRVLFSSRLESGSLHLCGGSLAVSFSPCGSLL